MTTRFLWALSVYAVLALMAAFTLDGNMRLAVWILLAGLTVKTVIAYNLHANLPGPDGTPLPFDRSAIYPYAFRHSYAQRHADAGVSVEILKELMDHKDLSVTQGYYTNPRKLHQTGAKAQVA